MGLWEQNLSPPGLSLCWCRHLGLLCWDWLAAGASLGPCGQRPGWDFTVPPSGCWGQSYSPRPSAQSQVLSVTLCEVALWGVLPPWCAWPKPQPPGFPLNLEPPGPCMVYSSALLVRTEDCELLSSSMDSRRPHPGQVWPAPHHDSLTLQDVLLSRWAMSRVVPRQQRQPQLSQLTEFSSGVRCHSPHFPWSRTP